jgi:hypothetical protein
MENEETPVGSTSERELTFGQKAVGLTFNPSGDERVYNIKLTCAKAIDELNNQRNQFANPDSESGKLYERAIRTLQDAQMQGVKAATWKD